MDLLESMGSNSETPLPRSNGELVFEKPWESRAFGIAAALADSGAFEWSEFQSSLITAISQRDDSEPYRYYECWLEALESLVIENGFLSAQDLDSLVEIYRQRPADHDHHHDDHSNGPSVG